jgi:hypothetical protein
VGAQKKVIVWTVYGGGYRPVAKFPFKEKPKRRS